ncbi:MAG: hypothetical protein DLM58_24610 [Pseudonocardiales bacterium]|nr:MAG: hypothetical protein DLM58_24610 [Pseudonocardiales bacterium]
MGRRGRPVPEQIWTHLTPWLWEHVHVVGHYRFEEPVSAGERRRAQALRADASCEPARHQRSQRGPQAIRGAAPCGPRSSAPARHPDVGRSGRPGSGDSAGRRSAQHPRADDCPGRRRHASCPYPRIACTGRLGVYDLLVACWDCRRGSPRYVPNDQRLPSGSRTAKSREP